MTAIEVHVSDSLLEQVRDLAAKEQLSVDQFAANAIAEKVAASADMAYLQRRAERGSRDKFLEAMGKVPHVSPVPPDELPPHK